MRVEARRWEPANTLFTYPSQVNVYRHGSTVGIRVDVGQGSVSTHGVVESIPRCTYYSRGGSTSLRACNSSRQPKQRWLLAWDYKQLNWDRFALLPSQSPSTLGLKRHKTGSCIRVCKLYLHSKFEEREKEENKKKHERKTVAFSSLWHQLQGDDRSFPVRR